MLRHGWRTAGPRRFSVAAVVVGLLVASGTATAHGLAPLPDLSDRTIGAIRIASTAPAALSCTSPVPRGPGTVARVPARAKNVLRFGAIGNGRTDDSAAIQRALDSLAPGDTLVFPAGRVFAHTKVLRAMVARTRLTGGATLKATNQQASSLMVLANGVTVDNLTLANSATTRRWDAYEQTALLVRAVTGASIHDLRIAGSGSAGLHLAGASNFTVSRVVVDDTRSDAIHITEGSHDGTLSDLLVRRSGDDGVAVVSYHDGSPAVSRITVQRARVVDQKWGRAFSVVGGSQIAYKDIQSEASVGAALYIASEGEYRTLPATDVTVDGASFVRSNSLASVDHGAILLYNSQSTVNRDISLSNVRLCDTRSTASRQIGILNANGGRTSRVTIRNVSVIGGPSNVFGTNAPSSAYRLTGWLVNGRAVADRVGW